MNKPMGIENAIRDTTDMRKFLTQALQEAATGRFDSDRADRCKAIANLSQQIYNTLNIEVRMAVAKVKLGDVKVEPVKFGD